MSFRDRIISRSTFGSLAYLLNILYDIHEDSHALTWSRKRSLFECQRAPSAMSVGGQSQS